MSTRKISIRIDGREQQMLNSLLASWTKSGRCTTDSDVLRKCLLDAFNHQQRSNGRPQLSPLAGDQGGELRRGRPRKTLKAPRH